MKLKKLAYTPGLPKAHTGTHLSKGKDNHKHMSRFGLDPELFLVKGASNYATSVHLIDFKGKTVKSDTENPVASMVKTDGFAVEFTNTPSGCRDYIVPSMAAGLKDFLTTWPEYTLSAKASMTLTGVSVKGRTPTGVCNYGCIPDRNAYTLEEKTAPGDHYHNQKRYIGGHIHYGLHGFPEERKQTVYTMEHLPLYSYGQDWMNIVGAAYTLIWDAYVGVPMVALLGNANDYGEEMRRTYYGQAGSHRIKKYGVEYRVLSGALMMSPFILGWAMGAMRAIIRTSALLKPFALTYQTMAGQKAQTGPRHCEAYTPDLVTAEVEKWFKKDSLALRDVKEIINTHDVKAARDYVTAHKDEIYNYPFVKVMIDADKKGIKIPTNISKAWALETATIKNHQYKGVEKLMRGDTIKKEQFGAIDLVKPVGWSKNL